MTIKYIIDSRQIEITEPDEQGHYYVVWENILVGFLFKMDLGIVTDYIIWAGSTPYLSHHSAEIGNFIENYKS